MMPTRSLCNNMQREGVKPSPVLASVLFCYALLYNFWFGTKIINYLPFAISAALGLFGRATLIGEKAQASLRGRPRGRLGTDGSGKGCVRGRPRGRLGSGGLAPAALRGRPGLLGSTQATGATLYSKSSR